MTSIAVITVCLAVVVFFAYHAVIIITEYKRRQALITELETVKKELEDEILHGGNTARIGQLRERMLYLEQLVYGK